MGRREGHRHLKIDKKERYIYTYIYIYIYLYKKREERGGVEQRQEETMTKSNEKKNIQAWQGRK